MVRQVVAGTIAVALAVPLVPLVITHVARWQSAHEVFVVPHAGWISKRLTAERSNLQSVRRVGMDFTAPRSTLVQVRGMHAAAYAEPDVTYAALVREPRSVRSSVGQWYTVTADPNLLASSIELRIDSGRWPTGVYRWDPRSP